MKFYIIILVTVSVAQANLITNGSFEQPVIPYADVEIFTSIEGWTTTYGFSVEIQARDSGGGTPYEGDQLIELDGLESSNIIQDVATVNGENYQLSFAYAGRPEAPSGLNEIDVYWNNMLLDQLRRSAGLTDWEVKTYTVTATSDSTSLEFRDVGESTSYGGYLDDIRLTPEPTTLLLLGFGGLMVRRKRC